MQTYIRMQPTELFEDDRIKRMEINQGPRSYGGQFPIGEPFIPGREAQFVTVHFDLGGYEYSIMSD